jgi:hypothetical protein
MEKAMSEQRTGMKAKTIKAIIRKKMNAWLGTLPDDLRSRVERNIIVTGGAIASMLLGEQVSDFDVYLRTHAATKDLADYYVSQFQATCKRDIKVTDEAGRVKIVVQSVGVASQHEEVLVDPEMIEDTYQETEEKALANDEEKYRPIFLTSNAITLSGKVQIIIRFYGEPEEIHKNYDFVHCTNYWESKNDELTLKSAALEALLSRELRYVGSKYPICSMVRVRKFVARGWRINAGQLVKMAFQISKLNLEDFAVLEDQLTGVDTAYFIQLIEKLKEKNPEKVNAAYLLEILDRLF